MKRLLCLLFLLFVLTGCDVEYNLKIAGDVYTENINISVPNTGNWKTIVNNVSNMKQISYINESSGDKYYYDLDINKDENKYKIKYDYKFNKYNIINSSAINRCYNIVGIEDSDEDNSMTFYTNTIFKCLYTDGVQVIDKATINIITPLKVLDNNADKVDGNKYTWVIDETNFENKPISIKMEKPKPVDKKSQTTLIIIIGLILVAGVGYIIYRFLRRKHIKRNEI